MNYNDFINQVEAGLLAMLPEGVSIEIKPVMKNNGTKMDGLLIMEPDCNIAPTIYLNCFYEEYETGRDMEDILQEIMAVYRENAVEENMDMSFFLEYSKVKDRIAYKLINYDKNKELLEQVPHIRFLDLAVVFYYMVNAQRFDNATILIYNDHIKKWMVTAADLFSIASVNTPKLLKSEYRNMLEYLMSVNNELLPDGLELGDIDPDDIIPMYILSNQAGLYGASCILYRDVLRKFAKYLEANLIILPSSVHEVIVVPDNGDALPDHYRDMVEEVNKSTVAAEEILSNSVYYYSREEDLVSIYA